MPSQEISSSNRTVLPEEGRRLVRSLNACGQESRVTLGALVCAARLSANASSCSRRPMCSRGGSPSNQRKWSASAAHSRMNVLLPTRRLPWQTMSEAAFLLRKGRNSSLHARGPGTCAWPDESLRFFRCLFGILCIWHLNSKYSFRCHNPSDKFWHLNKKTQLGARPGHTHTGTQIGDHAPEQWHRTESPHA